LGIINISRSHAPRSAWECRGDALRVGRGTRGTQSVHSAFPRGAWERAENVGVEALAGRGWCPIKGRRGRPTG